MGLYTAFLPGKAGKLAMNSGSSIEVRLQRVNRLSYVLFYCCFITMTRRITIIFSCPFRIVNCPFKNPVNISKNVARSKLDSFFYVLLLALCILCEGNRMRFYM